MVNNRLQAGELGAYRPATRRRVFGVTLVRIPLSDHVVLDVFRVRRVSHLWSVDLHFDRRLQVGGSCDRLGGELVDRVILSEFPHRGDEQPQVDDLEMGGKSPHRLSDR